MGGSSQSILRRLLGAAVLGMGLGLWGGCDTVPAPDREKQPPSVSSLQVVPDSVHESDLPSEQVQDSVAGVPLRISVRATDTDGTIARVVFVLEPSSNPRGSLSRELPAENRPLYEDEIPLSVPLLDEVYTVRVFALDDDSLSSNQMTGQFRFVPANSSDAEATFERILDPKMGATSRRDVPALN